jgi:hypothetical protein
MKQLLAIMSITCILWSLACKKDVEQKPNEGTELLMTKRKKLSYGASITYYLRNSFNKIVEIRDSSESSSSSFKTASIEYDPGGKASKVDFFNSGSTISHSNLTVVYNANSTVKETHYTSTAGDKVDEYYTYDVAGHLIADSIVRKLLGPPKNDTMLNTWIYTGDNATLAEEFEIKANGRNSIRKITFEYDNAFNPYKNIDNYYQLLGNTTPSDIRYNCRNNIIKESIKQGSTMLIYEYHLRFNSSNYPWKNKRTGDPDTDTETEYFYKK